MTKAKNHDISAALIKAYRMAVYTIQLQEREIVLQIGQTHRELVQVMKEHEVNTAAFLTAFNPYGQVVSTLDNQSAQKQLLSDLAQLKIPFLLGKGQDIDRLWPEETSVLALGIRLQDAEILADRYRQNAFVWIGTNDGFVSLRLRYPIAIPTPNEAQQWIDLLPLHLQHHARSMTSTELAWLMSVPDAELEHWLLPESWDLNIPWPLARPDGSAMGVGTELDRVFRLIHSGVQTLI